MTRNKALVSVRHYYLPPAKSKRGPTSFDYQCRHCPRLVAAPLAGTTNLRRHQEKCPNLREAIKKGSPGIPADLIAIEKSNKVSQTLLNPESGHIILPFDKAVFLNKVSTWVASDALAFRIVESPKLRELLTYANPLAKLCSADTITRITADQYDIVKEKVNAEIRALNTTVHYAYDAWTDKFRASEYFGIYVYWIDDTFQYREVLLRLIHLNKHDGVSIGTALFQLFEQIGITKNIGPGTADNASVNGATAKALNNLVFDKHLYDLPARNLVGCMCHIASLAASAFLKEEGKLIIHKRSSDVMIYPSTYLSQA